VLGIPTIAEWVVEGAVDKIAHERAVDLRKSTGSDLR